MTEEMGLQTLQWRRRRDIRTAAECSTARKQRSGKLNCRWSLKDRCVGTTTGVGASIGSITIMSVL